YLETFEKRMREADSGWRPGKDVFISLDSTARRVLMFNGIELRTRLAAALYRASMMARGVVKDLNSEAQHMLELGALFAHSCWRLGRQVRISRETYQARHPGASVETELLLQKAHIEEMSALYNAAMSSRDAGNRIGYAALCH